MEDAPLETLAASPSAPSNGAGFMYGTPSMLYISWAEPDSGGSAPITNYLLTLTPDDQPAVEHLVQAPIQSYMEAIECTSIQASVKASNDSGLTYGAEYIFPLITYIHVPPSPPSSAQAIVIDMGVASISWTAPEVAPEGAAYYSIKTNSSDPNDPILIFRTVDMTQTTYTIATLNLNSEYYFTIEIENQSGSSLGVNTNTIFFKHL